MAARLMGEALRVPGLSDVDRLVLVAFADFADARTHRAWPSLPTVARVLEKSPKTIRRAKDRLVGRGLLAEHQTRPGRSTTYIVMPPTPDTTVTGVHPGQTRHVTPVKSATTPATNMGGGTPTILGGGTPTALAPDPLRSRPDTLKGEPDGDGRTCARAPSGAAPAQPAVDWEREGAPLANPQKIRAIVDGKLQGYERYRSSRETGTAPIPKPAHTTP